jgi:CRISPR-associated protein Csm3
MKHHEYIQIKGILTCDTGLKIGGKKDGEGIGETDNPIIRHPITRLPYIPGSSMKGKLRSLLEMKYCESTQRTGKPCTEPPSQNDISALFGSADMQRNAVTQPSRLIFRDSSLTGESRQVLDDNLPGMFAEIKPEIAMDRIQGKTSSGSLRENERVPAGSKFELEVVLRVFEEDMSPPLVRKNSYLHKLAEGFEMLAKDYLGGNGTRGYGKVTITAIDGKTPISEYIRSLESP